MATIAVSPTAGELPYLFRTQARTAPRPTWGPLAALLVIGTLALVIRTWSMGATLASSDQAGLAWLIHHGFGFKWLFAHHYGPVLVFVQRTWAEVLSRLGLPIGETAMRIPIALASMLQVGVTFLLVRRLGRTAFEAVFCSLVCAILPTLVSDAHFIWGYNTLWVLTGTVALWGTLAWLEADRPGWLLLAAVSLILHCLCNCFAFALPIALLYVWFRAMRASSACDEPSAGLRQLAAAPLDLTTEKKRRQADAVLGETENGAFSKPHGATKQWPPMIVPRRALPRTFAAGFVLPCLIAITIIFACWFWTGHGQIGHLLFKREVGSTGLRILQIAKLPGMWAVQFGYLFGIAAAVGLFWGSLSPRTRVLAVWCWAGLVPLVLFVEWSRVGHMALYLLECAYTAGILGALWICAAYRRLRSYPALRTAFAGLTAMAVTHMGLGTVDACIGGGQYAAITGVPILWGSVRTETGIKAAGWYVRTQVPVEAVVMATHTNVGMESTVAEYYCGRAVLADYDLRPDMIAPLVHAMQNKIDVLIVEPDHAAVADGLAGFERVATFRDGDSAVRYIYARSGLRLPRVNAQAGRLSERFDRECTVRKVPQVLSSSTRLDACLGYYLDTVKRLRKPT